MRNGIWAFSALVIFLLVPRILPAESGGGKNLDRVTQALNGIPYERRSLLSGYGGFGSSILVRSQGKDTEGATPPGTFVVAVPLGADFAVDTALALAKKIQNREEVSQREVNRNLLVAFLGDEQNELPPDCGGNSYKGLRDLLSLADMPENWVVCYLDAAAPPGELVIRHGIRGYIAPLDIIKSLPGLFRSHGIPWSFNVRFNLIYKLGLVEGPQALSIAWGNEINGFVLSGAAGKETVSPESLADLLLDYADTLNLPVLNPDSHYFSFTFPGKGVLFIDEGTTTFVLLVITGIFLFVFLVYSARYNAILLFNIRLFISHIWIFFIILLFMTVSIRASGLLYALLFSLLKGPPGVSNFSGAGLTVLLAILVFLLPSPALSLLHFPRRTHFYGYSAVIFVIIGIFFAAFLDFSYVPIFLWVFLFVFLGASLSRPVPVFLCVLIVPFFTVGALINIIGTGNDSLAELYISSGWNNPENWWAAFQAALLSLPLFLLIRRGIILKQNSKRRTIERKPGGKFRLIVLPVLIAVVLGTMVIQILQIPKQRIAPERKFINDVSVTGNGNGIINLSFKNVVFQDSRIITLSLGARGSPKRFDVSLESDNGLSLLPIYTAPVPFEREDEGKRINFSLGENPPNPLVLQIVVPKDFEGILETTALYNTRDDTIDPGLSGAGIQRTEGKSDTDDYVLRVSKVINLAAP